MPIIGRNGIGPFGEDCVLETCLLEEYVCNLGGRVVLLNSVMNSTPSFLLSFLKMLGKFWKKLIRMHRKFLCGSSKGGSKVAE